MSSSSKNKLTLYTTGCPQCVVLETKLDRKNISYTKVTDVIKIKEAGFYSVPILVVENKDGSCSALSFNDANTYINNI